MTIVSFALALAAVAVQIFNIVLVARNLAGRSRSSQILLVPCVFYYLALVLRNDGFFTDKATEFGVAVLVHVVLSGILFAFEKAFRPR